MNPLTWGEIVAKTGRSKAEISALQMHLEDLGGTVESVCPSKLCIFARVNLSNNNNATSVNPEELTSLLHTSLRRSLRQSNGDETIVSGVTLVLSTPQEPGQQDEATGWKLGTAINKKPSPFQTMQQALNDTFPGNTFFAINDEIWRQRLDEVNTTLYDLNRLSYISLPTYCYNSTSVGMMQSIPLDGGKVSCPQTLTVTYTTWETDAFAFNNNLMEFTVQLSDLPSNTCGSILGSGKCVDELVEDSGSGTIINLEWHNDTLIRTLDFASFLSSGLTYYIHGVSYSDGFAFTFYLPLSLGPSITPVYAKKIYNVPEGHKGAGLGVTALFVPFANAYSQAALEAANTAFNISTPSIELFTSSLFPGMNVSQCFLHGQQLCGESNLDVQMITQYGAGAQFGLIPGDILNPNVKASDYDIFVGYREALIEQNVYPDVLSLSWGAIAPHVKYHRKSDDVLMALSTAGITILVATGDRGAAGVGAKPCNPFEETFDYGAVPAMSSWVLAVGATQQAQLPGENGPIGSVACMGPNSLAITSTGKILSSDVMPMPDYQSKAVRGYLKSTEFKNWPYTPRKIPSPGRGIPDVSAFGAFIPSTLEDGSNTVFSINEGGTSAASPAFAGLLLQVRGALLKLPQCANKTMKFGHINPMIYWMAQHRPDAFIDITIGNNIFDGQLGPFYDFKNCEQGFVAAKGWDPVTGVGMMNFTGFVSAAAEWMCTGISTCGVTNKKCKKSADCCSGKCKINKKKTKKKSKKRTKTTGRCK